MSLELQLLKTIRNPDWKQRSEKFKQSIDRTRAFALGDAEKMFQYVPIDSFESVAKFKQKTKGKRDIIKKALQAYLDGLSGLPVTRTVPSFPDYDLNRYEKNLNLQKLQTKVEVGGTVAVRPYVNFKGEISYEMFEAWQLCPLTQGEELVALGIVYDNALEIWTHETYTTYGSGGIETLINPYGTIPFSIFRANVNDGDWFGVSDLTAGVTNNITILKLLTDLQELAKNQSYSWPVYKGPQPEEPQPGAGTQEPIRQVNLGPDRILTIPTEGELSILTPEASIKEILDAADSMAERTFEDLCVSSVIKTSTAQSGYSLKVQRSPYLSKMATKRVIWTPADQRLIELAVLVDQVNSQSRPLVLDEKFKVRTTFDDAELTPESPDEVQKGIERDKMDLDIGLVSRIDLLMEKYGISREQAMDMARRIDSENAEFSRTTEAEQSLTA